MREPTNMRSTLTTTDAKTDDRSQDLALTIAQAADDRKGADILILRVAQVSYLTDYFVIVTGFSKAQVRAISQSIAEKMESVWQRLPIRTEGQANSSWILQDYGEVIAHIFLPQEREFYNLEAFWGHAQQINFQASQPLED
ncbi:MAG: ribosome silencing factor [Symploca sp. SIO3C6]|uniref:Ribosomal silencing factor RsfS n=1 Tax=Symploca sp. SIO1C4 TaxID=2607765 RepID=A0A6B3NG38_9CYAN|nr:ribosome silencing factor [Symploca sp. SIO3C6]NER28248.1 ribosome silencing factor [Symploca sp. SIO1C4]NET03709.1 ribosome silencing factor [Symploca sp. SIO2B6]NET50629.1 ribosome silencing factor [Merismopedia sp. SIO2A8]